MTFLTENGWPSCTYADCDNSTIPGTDVAIPLQAGQPNTIMKAFAADFNTYVQPLRQADCGGWTATNSVATSNHLGGTAMDLDWDSHPFQVSGTFTADQMVTIRALLAFYEDTIYWGGDWSSPIDEMHWQMGYNTYQNPSTQDFINRKIGPDGFSTYRQQDGWTPVLDEILGIG